MTGEFRNEIKTIRSAFWWGFFTAAWIVTTLWLIVSKYETIHHLIK